MRPTRGPWSYDDDTATIENENGVAVAGVNVDLEEYEANANLLAAAPEMADYIRLHASHDPEARRILAKAEGR